MKRIKLSEVLKQQKDIFEVEDHTEYRQVTVSNTGEIKLRSIKKGSEIGTKKQYKIKSGEFIYSRLGIHQGSFGIVPEELDGAIVTGDMPVFRIDKSKILPEILIFLLGQKRIRDIFDDLTRGLAQSRIREKYLLDIEIPNLKIERQKQILNKINKVESEIKQVETNISHDKTLLKSLRSAILSEAVQGKLVPQNIKDESALELLNKIKAEKEKLIKEGKIKKQKPLPEISDDEVPYNLPNGWVWCRLGDVCGVKGGKRIPKGYLLQDKPTDHIYIRVTDMKNGTIKDNKLKYVSEEVYQLIKNYTISKDDLYITIAGTIGDVGFVPKKFDNMNLTENAAKIINYGINKFFLKSLLSSKFARDQFLNKINQMAQPKLALMRILTTVIPLPPLAEQKRIVEKVDALMKMCDELELKIKENKINSESLMGAVLGEVFENGED